ncbi:uncharacterized protein DS421_20g686300 [Arachis hypogaea]|nr:uncharacterized protein DS421_20g686300 [Arachis hypogaea]
MSSCVLFWQKSMLGHLLTRSELFDKVYTKRITLRRIWQKPSGSVPLRLLRGLEPPPISKRERVHPDSLMLLGCQMIIRRLDGTDYLCSTISRR